MKTVRYLHPRYLTKIIGDILKNVQKTSTSFKRSYMIPDNESEAGNENEIILIRHK